LNVASRELEGSPNLRWQRNTRESEWQNFAS
jgi:hypothetical protein